MQERLIECKNSDDSVGVVSKIFGVQQKPVKYSCGKGFAHNTFKVQWLVFQLLFLKEQYININNDRCWSDSDDEGKDDKTDTETSINLSNIMKQIISVSKEIDSNHKHIERLMNRYSVVTESQNVLLGNVDAKLVSGLGKISELEQENLN